MIARKSCACGCGSAVARNTRRFASRACAASVNQAWRANLQKAHAATRDRARRIVLDGIEAKLRQYVDAQGRVPLEVAVRIARHARRRGYAAGWATMWGRCRRMSS